jgi:hypothetical protein
MIMLAGKRLHTAVVSGNSSAGYDSDTIDIGAMRLMRTLGNSNRRVL